MAKEKVALINIYPELLGTYGDRGNLIILKKKLEFLNIKAEIINIEPGEAVPELGDLYMLGGGEDDSQKLAVCYLKKSKGFFRAVNNGSFIFAICAGFQLLGMSFPTRDGIEAGVEVLAIDTFRSAKKRAVGEVICRPNIPELKNTVFSGYENHAGRTVLGKDVSALSYVKKGIGNGYNNVDGVIAENILGTYLHGPVLARNPELANYIIGKITGLTDYPNNDLDELALLLKKSCLKRARKAEILMV